MNGVSKRKKAPAASKRAKSAAAGGLLLCLFPVFAVLLCEFNQMQSIAGLWDFLSGKFGVFAFDLLVFAAVFFALLLAVGRGWIAALASGGVLFIMSFVEFFKYDVSGSHFSPQDIVLAGKLDAIAGMARLRLTAGMAIALVLFVAYILALAFARARVKAKTAMRVALPVVCLGAVAAVIVTGALYGLFGVDSRVTYNPFIADTKFKNDNMLAYFLSETTNRRRLGADKPKGYSEELVAEVLKNGALTDTAVQGGVNPNVVIILSESCSDFRRIADGVPDTPYANFDKLSANGYGGTAVLPTFGGYTGRSEFELLTGLPVAALGDPITPYMSMKNAGFEGIPALFRRSGYSTVYLHPYFAKFYDRNTVYPRFGFDRLIFAEDLDIENHTFHNYADDGYILGRVTDAIRSSEQPVFMFVMTMQNHQPYYFGEERGLSELDYFLEGLAHTDEALGKLASDLEAVGESTIVLYLGDHYPFFSGKNTVYTRGGFDETNCAVLFENSYAVWSNYGADFSDFVDAGKVSLFYLPHLLARTAGVDLGAFSRAMLAEMECTPIYTTPYLADRLIPNKVMSVLTYDRLIGAGYSDGA